MLDSGLRRNDEFVSFGDFFNNLLAELPTLSALVVFDIRREIG